MASSGTTETQPAALRLSTSLGRVPPPAAPAAPAVPFAAAPTPPAPAPVAVPAPAEAADSPVAPEIPPPRTGSIAHGVAALRDAASAARTAPSLVPLTVTLGGIALVSSIGWW